MIAAFSESRAPWDTWPPKPQGFLSATRPMNFGGNWYITSVRERYSSTLSIDHILLSETVPTPRRHRYSARIRCSPLAAESICSNTSWLVTVPRNFPDSSSRIGATVTPSLSHGLQHVLDEVIGMGDHRDRASARFSEGTLCHSPLGRYLSLLNDTIPMNSSFSVTT